MTGLATRLKRLQPLPARNLRGWVALTLTVLAASGGFLTVAPQIAVAAESTEAKAAENPIVLLKRSTENVRKVLNRTPKTPAEETARDDDLKKEINQFIDFDELGKRALGSNWAGLNPQQQKDFLATLRDLIETAYTTRIRETNDFAIEYTKEEFKDGEAFVATLAKSPGSTTKLSTDYRLHKPGDRWYVYDLVIEGSSLVNTYKKSFNQIIKQKGFDALMQKMKTKSEDLRKDKARDKAKKAE
jgi:phospholipid transport system substrate-binding protein